MGERVSIKWNLFGRDLRKWRIAYGKRFSFPIGVRDAARAIGTSHSTYSRIENGKPCTVEAFFQVCLVAKLDTAKYVRIKP